MTSSSLATPCCGEELRRGRKEVNVNGKLMASRAEKMRLEESDKKGSPGSWSTVLRYANKVQID